VLPPDSHVHSQWSWDALAGSMERTCLRALELGLPSLAFTEHADLTPWTLTPGQQVPDAWHPLLTDGVLTAPPIDLTGYRTCLELCRQRHPDLRILSGVELSEPHWHATQAHALIDTGEFQRVLASVHSAATADGSGFTEVSARYDDQEPGQVIRSYLAEAARLIEQFDAFEVLAHIDYPVRYWPAHAEPYDPEDFAQEYRHTLTLLAAAGKVLEVNTRVPLHPQVLSWWQEVGGQAISFASDAHDPLAVAHGFPEALQIARAAGFRPGRHPHDFWIRN